MYFPSCYLWVVPFSTTQQQFFTQAVAVPFSSGSRYQFLLIFPKSAEPVSCAPSAGSIVSLQVWVNPTDPFTGLRYTSTRQLPPLLGGLNVASTGPSSKVQGPSIIRAMLPQTSECQIHWGPFLQFLVLITLIFPFCSPILQVVTVFYFHDNLVFPWCMSSN